MSCLIMVEIENCSTVLMRNRKYAHKGKCAVCSGVVLKIVKEHEFEQVMAYNNVKERVPKQFIAGKETPARLVKKIEVINHKKDLEKGEINAKTSI